MQIKIVSADKLNKQMYKNYTKASTLVLMSSMGQEQIMRVWIQALQLRWWPQVCGSDSGNG